MAITNWRRTALACAGLLAALALLAFIYARWVKSDMTDFGVCTKAGGRILAGVGLYTARDGHLQFKYSPPAALFFAPFSLLPGETAKALWFALSLAFLFAALYLSTELLPVKRRAGALLMALTVLVLAKCIGREIELGQVNILIILSLTLTLWLMLQGKHIAAGLFWGFSIFFKPYALVLMPYFLLKKKFKLLAVGLALYASGLLLPVALYGYQAYREMLKEWVGTLSESTPVLFTVQANASLYSFFLKVFAGEPARTARVLLFVSCLIFAALILWMMRAGRKAGLAKPEVLEVSFLFILIPMLSPLGWYYNYLYSLLAVAVLLNDFSRFPAGWRWALAVNFFILCAVPMGILGGALFHFYMKYSLAVINFFVVFSGLFYLRARKTA